MKLKRGSQIHVLARFALEAGCVSGVAERLFVAPKATVCIRKSECDMFREGIMEKIGQGNNKALMVVLDNEEKIEKFRRFFGDKTVEYYLTKARNGKIDKRENHIERYKRISEVMVALYRDGVIVFSCDKTIIVRTKHMEIREYYDVKVPHFYSMADMRKMSNTPMSGYTRMCGVLISAGGMYPVYNYVDHFTWNNNGEENMTRSVHDVFAYFYNPAMKAAGILQERRMPECIVFGRDMSVAEKYCLYPYAKRKYKAKGSEVEYVPPAIHNRVYKAMRYIPLTLDGLKALRLIMMENWKQKFLTIRPYTHAGDAYDWYDSYEDDAKGREYYFYFIGCDLHKLYDFITHMTLKNEKKTVVCYDWQAEMVEHIAKITECPVNVFHNPTSLYVKFFAKDITAEHEYWDTHSYIK